VDRSLQLYPDNVRCQHLQGCNPRIARQGLTTPSNIYLRSLALPPPTSAAAIQTSALRFMKKGQFQEAVSVLQAGVQSNPRDPDVLRPYCTLSSRPAVLRMRKESCRPAFPPGPTIPASSTTLPTSQRKLGKSTPLCSGESQIGSYELAPNDADINLDLGSLLVETVKNPPILSSICSVPGALAHTTRKPFTPLPSLSIKKAIVTTRVGICPNALMANPLFSCVQLLCPSNLLVVQGI